MIDSERLNKLLRPRSICFVGASSKSGFQIGGSAALAHLIQHGFSGEILLVSRSAPAISGRSTYVNANALPYVPDCVVISVPAEYVENTVKDHLVHGTRSFIILSTGFSERGTEGRERETRLKKLLDSHGAVALGPNTTGFINFSDRIALSTTSRLQGRLPLTGSIGLVLQSGALGSTFLEYAADSYIGLSYLISIGNSMSTGIADYINALLDDIKTKAIVLYVEGFDDPIAFAKAAARARDCGKPIIILKVGRTEIGERAAAGHTGAMTGSSRVHSAVFKQLGIVQAESVSEALAVAQILADGRRVGDRIGVATPSGGLGGLLCDALSSRAPFEFPSLLEQTAANLQINIPKGQVPTNPLDVAAVPFARHGALGEVMHELLIDRSLESVIFASTPIVDSWSEAVVESVTQARRSTTKFVGVVWETGTFNSKAVNALRKDGVPVFNNTKDCANTLSLVQRWENSVSDWSPHANADSPDSHELPTQNILDEAQSTELLRPYIERCLPASILVKEPNFEKLRSAAEKIGYPVVLKVLVQGIIHKSDVGLVMTNINNEDNLARAFESQSKAIKNNGHLVGFLVVEQVAPKAEVIIGINRDREFGLVMTFGAGGVFTEIINDTSIRVLPASRGEFREMIDECKISQVLNGARGAAGLDVDAIIDTMIGITDAALSIGPRLNSVEINPLGVMERGRGVKALDAKIFLAPRDTVE